MVGQNEHTITLVGGTDCRRRNSFPFRIEPEFGQSSQESPESIPGKKPSDVFHDCKRGFHFANDAKEFVDQVALVLLPSLLSCEAIRLARYAAKNDVHESTKRGAVELFEIAENRRAVQGLRFHPCQERGLGEGFPLNVTHNSGAECSGNADVEPADTGTNR